MWNICRFLNIIKKKGGVNIFRTIGDTISTTYENGYADVDLKIYQGCSAKCKHCISSDLGCDDPKYIFDRIKLDCEHDKYKNKLVHLSYHSDPYQSINKELQLTARVIELLSMHNINFQVVTKGGLFAKNDFKYYKPGDRFGTTVTTLDNNKQLCIEPNVQNTANRLYSVNIATTGYGIDTFVNIDVMHIADALDIINKSVKYTNLFRVKCINENISIDTWTHFIQYASSITDKFNKRLFDIGISLNWYKRSIK